jgi:hypothetical protein
MSDNMKLIMESWRSWAITKKLVGDKFMRDPRGPINIDEEDIPLALYIHVEGGEYTSLILYRPIIKSKDITSDGLNTKVIGMINLEDSGDSCIPDTFQVAHSAAATKGKGYGSLMYGLAFRYANMNGYGLTSDHGNSTSADAKVLWDRYADTKGMVKKKTKAGNDKFDYYEKTDDKEDDCGMDVNDTEKHLATDHSWIDKNNEFAGTFDKLRAQHVEYIKSLDDEDREEFTQKLTNMGGNLFGRAYSYGE